MSREATYLIEASALKMQLVKNVFISLELSVQFFFLQLTPKIFQVLFRNKTLCTLLTNPTQETCHIYYDSSSSSRSSSSGTKIIIIIITVIITKEVDQFHIRLQHVTGCPFTTCIM